jgi:hypothetical protein
VLEHLRTRRVQETDLFTCLQVAVAAARRGGESIERKKQNERNEKRRKETNITRNHKNNNYKKGDLFLDMTTDVCSDRIRLPQLQ